MSEAETPVHYKFCLSSWPFKVHAKQNKYDFLNILVNI